MDQRYAFQKARVAYNAKIGAVDRGDDAMTASQVAGVERFANLFQDVEDQIDQFIVDAVKDEAIVQAMTQVKGVGLMTAAKLVSMIDITRSDTISALWRYCGLAVIDGERERRRKGERLHYNARLKATCYLIGVQFLRGNSPYRDIYDSSKAYYEANRPDWTKAHIHMASLRRMVKMFLAHLYKYWRTLERLPIREPYVQDRLGHEHIVQPADMGWPSIAP